jgi:hypothetical protein
MVAGVLAGLAGGLAFGVLMILPVITGRGLSQTGLLSQLSRLVGTEDLGVLWSIHAAMSAFFGVLFAAFVSPRDRRRVVPLAMAYGVLLWLFGAFLALRILVHEPLVITGALLYNLLGHLAFGAALGLSYLALFREEVGILRDHPGRAGLRRRTQAKP